MNVVYREGLPWPPHKPRCRDRKNSQFKGSGKTWGEPSVPEASSRIYHQVSAFTRSGKNCRTKEIAIWCYAPIGAKGAHISRKPSSDDPGVVVTFDLDGHTYTIACDRYTTISGNQCAIAAYIEGLRTQERHGVADLGEMLAGHMALPPASPEAWWEVLGVSREASADEIRSAYRAKIKVAHPDQGGNADDFARIQRAYEEATR